jgi:hypothetical protein
MLFRFHWALAITGFALVATVPPAAQAQDQRDEQFYYPGSFNWRFLKSYPEAARLFNAFDYGHAVLYERLYTKRGRAQEALEKDYQFLTTDLLIQPPRFAVVEELISPAYSKIAWRAKLMFDWAHVLHRQLYDIYADERLTIAQKDSLIERATDYYLSRKAYAFPAVPKSMDLMEGQYFSRTFRQAYPKFNGLIWAYHWLQVGLYEPFLEPGIPAEKKAGVKATVARFWSMLEDPPSRMPKMMPMTSAIAPRFSEGHPRAAAIFDNLHMTHDIISDILVADTIPHEQKRKVIYAQLDELQDTTSNVMSWDEWRNMGEMMGGVAAMGGPATALLAGVHAPVTPTPDTAGMEHGGMGHEMGAMRHEPMAAGKADSAAEHEMGAMEDTARAQEPGAHGKRHEMPEMQHPGPDSAGGAESPHMRQMMDLHMRMMADSVIRRRVMADTAMQRLMQEMMAEMPADHRKHMHRMMEGAQKKQTRPQAPQRREPEVKDSTAHQGHEMPD